MASRMRNENFRRESIPQLRYSLLEFHHFAAVLFALARLWPDLRGDHRLPYFIDNTAHVAAVRDPAEAAYVTSARIQSGEVIVIGPVRNRPTLDALP
jgi:hypothetical protein